MSMHAFNVLDDALDATKAFLKPLDRWTWLKLAFVAFFIGGPATSFVQVPPTGNSSGTSSSGTGGIEFSQEVLIAIVAIFAAIFLFVIALAAVGAIMEFVFYESLRERSVSVRAYWRKYWRKGLRLFAFRILLGLLVLAAVFLLAAPFILAVGGFVQLSAEFVLLLVVAAIPIFFLLAIATGVANGFTSMFVVPIMMLEDCTVLDGWRRLWPSIKANPYEYGAYLLMTFVLGLATGMIVGIATLVGLFVIAIPVVVLIFVSLALLTVAEPLGILGFVFTVAFFVLASVLLIALLKVPIQAYLRYYAVLVLGDIDDEFDFIPDQRREIRATADATAGTAPGDDATRTGTTNEVASSDDTDGTDRRDDADGPDDSDDTQF